MPTSQVPGTAYTAVREVYEKANRVARRLEALDAAWTVLESAPTEASMSQILTHIERVQEGAQIERIELVRTLQTLVPLSDTLKKRVQTLRTRMEQTKCQFPPQTSIRTFSNLALAEKGIFIISEEVAIRVTGAALFSVVVAEDLFMMPSGEVRFSGESWHAIIEGHPFPWDLPETVDSGDPDDVRVREILAHFGHEPV